MSCIRPGAVSTEDLVAYIAGEASELVADHVRACPQCSVEARGYARAERRLRPVLDRVACPSPHQLGEFELGLVVGDERWTIAGHVAECRRCAEELRTLRAFLVDDRLREPTLAERTRRVVAALLAPSPGLAYGGLRGAGVTPTRTFRADDVTITLGPGPVARRGRASLDGLIIGDQGDADQFNAREVRLIPTSGPPIVAFVDDLGNFLIEDVAPGVYRLELDLADRLIVVDDVPLNG
jgi:hypothetical protein